MASQPVPILTAYYTGLHTPLKPYSTLLDYDVLVDLFRDKIWWREEESRQPISDLQTRHRSGTMLKLGAVCLFATGGCTLACLLIMCSGVMRNVTNEDDLFAGVEGILLEINSVVYVTARFILLILAWIQLRGGTEVGAGMWEELNWTQFFIHFG